MGIDRSPKALPNRRERLNECVSIAAVSVSQEISSELVQSLPVIENLN